MNESSTKFFTCLFFLFMAVSIWFLSGCREEKSALGPGGETDSGDENVVAMIADKAVTGAELEAALKRIPENRRAKYRASVLNHLIEVKVFSEEARKAELDKDPQTKDALERAATETLARYFIRKYVDQQAEPSEEEVSTYYLEHKDQFVVPEGVMIQHIVVKKQEEAEALLKALQEGASFEELAKKKSIARSWKKGGRLGWLFKGRMEPELENVAFDLEKGKLSEVIETKKGYQVIKVLDRSDTRQMGFDEARQKIYYGLLGKRKRELIDTYYEAAKISRDPAEQGVLAKVGDEALTEETLAPILAKFPEKEREKAKQRWIRYFIETKVFSKEARKVGLESDPEVADELRRRTDELLASAFRKRFIADKFQISDKEVADYYQAHVEEFRIPVRVRARSILVKTKKEAEEIGKELKEGASFGHLAMKKSIGPSASSGGEMGWFGEGEKDAALEKLAFSLEKGQISDIFKTDAGYEIIKLMDKKGGGIRSLEEVGQAIKMTLTAQALEQERKRYYEKAGVKILGGA